MYKKISLLWLFLGLGSRLQIVASLSITELFVLVFAPFIFMKNYQQMRRDGVWTFFILSLLVILGCIIGSIANNSPPEAILRGMAVTCIVSCSIIFSHWILRRDSSGFKWFLVGAAISAIISTFIFQVSVEVATLGETAEEIMSGPIFWIGRLSALVMAPIKGWYIHCPTVLCVAGPIFLVAFSMLTSISGRSAALNSLGFIALVLIGGKGRRTMSRISRHFGMICCVGALIIGLFYSVYKFSASQGLLGEGAQNKYEAQTHGGQGGIARLILGGRGESFIGLLACRDKPIVGWGPWAMDEKGYAEEFIRKYGTWEDVQKFISMQEWRLRNGESTRMLPCHAYITEFWAWYGMFGLLFWLYVIFVLLRYLKQDVAAVPQWYAWLACSIPGMFWGIFFSPFSDRFGVTLFVVACLMARAVRKGQFQLPPKMIDEIKNTERIGIK